MTERATIVAWVSSCSAIAMVAWACAVGNIYSPTKPPKSAKEICASYHEARNTSFCMKIAERD